MKILRSALNGLLRSFSKNIDAQTLRTDLHILGFISKVMRLLNVPDAEFIREPWFLNTLYVISRSIADTPYGQPLSLVNPLLGVGGHGVRPSFKLT